MNSIVRNVTPCGFICTNVSEKPTANKFRVKDVCHNLTSKFHPKTGHEGPEGEYGYSSTLSLTSALDGSGWSTPLPGRSTPEKATSYVLQEAGWDKGRSERVQKISPLPGFDTQMVQSVASSYTD
jgi:hypothetical protein